MRGGSTAAPPHGLGAAVLSELNPGRSFDAAGLGTVEYVAADGAAAARGGAVVLAEKGGPQGQQRL
jgi:hypothetical protein